MKFKNKMEIAIWSLVSEAKQRGGVIDCIELTLEEAMGVLKEASSNPKYTIKGLFVEKDGNTGRLSTVTEYRPANVVEKLDIPKLLRMWRNCEILVSYIMDYKEEIRLNLVHHVQTEPNSPTNGEK